MLKPILLLVIFLNLVSGFFVLREGGKNWNTRLFGIVSFLASLWTFTNYMTGVDSTPFWLEATYASGAFVIASGLIWILYVADKKVGGRNLAVIITSAAIFGALSFMPGFIATHYTAIYTGGVFVGQPGMGLFIYTGIFLLASIIILYKLYAVKKKESDPEHKLQLKYVFFGVLFALIISGLSSFILPSLSIFSLGGLDSIGFLLFLSFIGFSIVKHHLFNIEVIATQILVFVLWIFILARVFLSETPQDRITNVALFFVTLVVGILLSRSVLREVNQRKELQKLSDLKTSFLSFASHQLKAPITSIQGYSSMLLEGSYGNISETQQPIVSRIFQSSRNLIKLITEFLDVTKMEQGGMHYSFAAVDVKKLLADLVEELKIIAQKKGLELSFSCKMAEPLINADELKLKQSLQNIIDNSIKYTERGYIHVTVEQCYIDTICIKISDSGIGMTDETRSKLFEKFGNKEGIKVNADSSGLGLYLAKKIVEDHGGNISVESPGLGKGSVFSLKFPAFKNGWGASGGLLPKN
jgi:signal transduction histidine kinase